MHPRFVISIANFFGAAHFFLVLYVTTPYLALYLPVSYIGLVVSLGAAGALFTFPFMPKLVGKFGSRKLALMGAGMQAIAVFILAFSPSLFFAIVCIALASALSPLIAYQLDLLLEALTEEEGSTGRIRTLFITAANTALILTPLLIGFLLGETSSYGRVFLAASLILAPFIALLLLERLPEGQPPRLSKIKMTFQCLWSNKDLRAATLGSGVLQFFFNLAPLYIPLYLHTVLGFPWSDLGWIFAVMLLPFLLIEYPAGYIADRWLGDKEMLITGFIITGIMFAAVGFITATTPLIVIAAILFLSRIGGALVEAMVESHFFRGVSERDANTISLFRMTRPLGSLITPLVASVLLLTGNYFVFFMVSGALIVALGIIVTIPLKDIR